MEIQNLPLFRELSSVLCSYKIESWQTKDFWEKVKLLNVSDNNINYQSVYRLIVRLANEGYLDIDFEKSKYNLTKYNENNKLQEFRSAFCFGSLTILKKISSEKLKFESELIYLEEEIDVLEELKDQFPDIQTKIEQLIDLKIHRIKCLEIKVRAIISLINYLSKS
ncbi:MULTISPECIES: hypothetical protein [Acinetobacter]|jgi:hypothetical protein|uniref:hypothetical protein n=1 Tax=Acinetobacter TaxID=469 RepID=UPI0015D3AD94|nr:MULTISPECIES: hypothetical protein [Acinetobacter]